MSIMAGCVDYKWRSRMCHKWQEEMRQKQLLQQLKVQQQQQQKAHQQQQQKLQQQQQQKLQQLQQQRAQQQQQIQQQQHQKLQQLQQKREQQQQQLQQQQQQKLQQMQKKRELQQQQFQKQQQQKLQQLQKNQQQQQQYFQLGKRSLSNFVEDPMNLHKLFLSRRTLQLFSYRPDFQRLVKSCFVRVSFGTGYRVAQIQGFGKCRSSNEPTLILRLDNNPRVFAMDQLSNNYFEQTELHDFACMWQANNFELPSKRIVEQKYQAITNAKLQSGAQLMNSARNCIRSMGMTQKLGKTRVSLIQDYRAMPYVYGKPNLVNKKVSSTSVSNSASTSSSASPTAQISKYLVEPLECYKPYLPKQLPTSTATSSTFIKPEKEPPTHPVSLKRKISLDEYRGRNIKK